MKKWSALVMSFFLIISSVSANSGVSGNFNILDWFQGIIDSIGLFSVTSIPNSYSIDGVVTQRPRFTYDCDYDYCTAVAYDPYDGDVCNSNVCKHGVPFYEQSETVPGTRSGSQWNCICLWMEDEDYIELEYPNGYQVCKDGNVYEYQNNNLYLDDLCSVDCYTCRVTGTGTADCLYVSSACTPTTTTTTIPPPPVYHTCEEACLGEGYPNSYCGGLLPILIDSDPHGGLGFGDCSIFDRCWCTSVTDEDIEAEKEHLASTTTIPPNLCYQECLSQGFRSGDCGTWPPPLGSKISDDLGCGLAQACYCVDNCIHDGYPVSLASCGTGNIYDTNLGLLDPNGARMECNICCSTYATTDDGLLYCGQGDPSDGMEDTTGSNAHWITDDHEDDNKDLKCDGAQGFCEKVECHLGIACTTLAIAFFVLFALKIMFS